LGCFFWCRISPKLYCSMESRY